ncbi:hypothetical protein JCM11641_006044 [Rhodosporidiobolus odoratus]
MATPTSALGNNERPAGLLPEVLEIFQDTSDDILPCGPAVQALLARTFSHLNNLLYPAAEGTRSARDHGADAATLAASLLRLSDEKLSSFPYKDVPLHWRRLYTDAVLLQAISRLAAATVQTGNQPAKETESMEETVKQLDMALIIAGAPGEGREELVFALIEEAQKRLRAVLDSSASPRPTKKRRLSPPPSPPRPLVPPYIHRPVNILSTLPSLLHPTSSPPMTAMLAISDDPSANSHNFPFVVRGAASPATGWKAVDLWKDLAYLEGKAGLGRVVPVEVGSDYTAEGWGQRIMPFSSFLQSLRFPTAPSHNADASRAETLYLAQHSLFSQFPSLLYDFTVPDLVYSAPSSDGATTEPYEGVQTWDGYILNAWLGPAGTKSAAHTDPWWNCYVQVTGKKWIWVAPPSCSSAMAAFGSPTACASEPSTSTSHPASTAASATSSISGMAEPQRDSTEPAQSQYMTNTSTLDVTVPPPPPTHVSDSSLSGEDGMKDSAQPDQAPHAYYPKEWLERVEPFAQQVVLEAGDVLVMPPRWWHAMKSLETSFSVSMWF